MLSDGQPTVSELDRSIARMERQFRQDLERVARDCERRAEGHVPQNLYTSEKANLESRIDDVRKSLTSYFADVKQELKDVKDEFEKLEEKKNRAFWATVTGIAMPSIVGLILLVANAFFGGPQ